MNKLLVMAAGLTTVMLASPAVLAGPRDAYGSYGEQPYGGDYYGSGQPAGGYGGRPAPARAYARVIDAQPIYRSVRVSQPRQECWDEQVVYRDYRYENNVAAGGLIGAVAGGVIGHQFGGGSGRAAATAVGAIVGANVGANSAAANTPAYPRTGYEQRCRTVADSYVEQRVEGYDVSYKYQGRVYRTQMPYDPGERIAIDVDVRPVAY